MNLGLPEIIIILVVIMLLFGPSQLPKLARGLGEAMKEFRRASSEITDEVKKASDESEKEKE
ncbi:MAG: twin-arginine translocase TatA/TatE family subunit [Thermotogae bacterium]|nr:twin-arginine translocase TatA/TatE family subunit [Thermotogota bacterium]